MSLLYVVVAAVLVYSAWMQPVVRPPAQSRWTRVLLVFGSMFVLAAACAWAIEDLGT